MRALFILLISTTALWAVEEEVSGKVSQGVGIDQLVKPLMDDNLSLLKNMAANIAPYDLSQTTMRTIQGKIIDYRCHSYPFTVLIAPKKQ